MPIWTFRFGDVFQGDDPLSVWVCTLGIAFNDAIYANLKVESAERPWERLYEWRVAVSHFTEACLHLQRGRDIEEVRAFVESDSDLQTMLDDVLARYEAVRGVAHRVRNEAAFHYPYESGQEALARALRELEDEEGAFGGSASTRVRDSRQLYADDVVSKLLVNASGGTEDTYREAAISFGEAVAAFGRFANAALDAYFSQHGAVLRRRDEQEGR